MFVRHVVVVVHDGDMSTVAPVLPVWFGSVNRNILFDSYLYIKYNILTLNMIKRFDKFDEKGCMYTLHIIRYACVCDNRQNCAFCNPARKFPLRSAVCSLYLPSGI